MSDLALTMQNKIMQIITSHPLFDEHFAGHPVLPGAFSIVACINSVINDLNTCNAEDYKLKKIKKFSFLKPILPGLTLTLKLIKIIEVDQAKHVYISLDDCDSQSYLKAILVMEKGL